MKILHLPTSVGGNAWGMSQAEKELGLISEVLIVEQNWLKYNCDYNLNLQGISFLQRVKVLYKWFKRANNYDVLHFNYGSSLLDFQKLGLVLLELPFYSKKQKIIFTYNGSDARDVHPIEYWDEIENPKKSLYQKIVKIVKKYKIKKVEKYADHIFALNPDLLYYLPSRATFLPYSISNWNEIKKYSYEIKDKIKIIHSPTSRELKGSDYILKALEKLEKKYDNIEVQIIENIPHKDALTLYQEADLVVDQVLIGWYGGFAVEVMKMGKPVAVNIREKDLKFIPDDMAEDLKKSIINITPFNIEEVLSNYIENNTLLYEKSKKAVEYVEKWHNPRYVAKIVKDIYEK
ncbi:MAG: hypothetical protein COA44_03540 [Arcobacter sp.]|nr:MAG: hypothetical protein COA44_03540 [Arcobacter sp.]